MNSLYAFPLSRYRFEFRVTKSIRLPDYAGSMLRGAFGHALRQLACMTRQKECEGCAVKATCPYPAVFSPESTSQHALQKFSRIPAPYVIEPPSWGARMLAEGSVLEFNMTLIGGAIKELPLIILAWRRALARGIGAAEGTAELARVLHCAMEKGGSDREIHRPEHGTVDVHSQTVNSVCADHPPVSRVVLHFLTPLRLQQNGHALSPERLEARTLLMALVRRASLLSEFHASGPLLDDFSAMLAKSSAVAEQRELVWRDWARFSSRQQQKIRLGGVVGTWQLEGELTPFLPYLRLGQWLHVGKEATFGMGGYALEESCEEDTSGVSSPDCERASQLIEKKEEVSLVQ